MRSVLWFREADEGSRRIETAGIRVFTVPLIETVPSDDLSGLNAATSRLRDYDGVFVTSRAAAEILAERARRELHESGVPVFVLGRRTMEVLKRYVSNLVFFPAAGTAAEMLESLEGRVRKNGRYLFVRGESS